MYNMISPMGQPMITGGAFAPPVFNGPMGNNGFTSQQPQFADVNGNTIFEQNPNAAQLLSTGFNPFQYAQQQQQQMPGFGANPFAQPQMQQPVGMYGFNPYMCNPPINNGGFYPQTVFNQFTQGNQNANKSLPTLEKDGTVTTPTYRYDHRNIPEMSIEQQINMPYSEYAMNQGAMLPGYSPNPFLNRAYEEAERRELATRTCNIMKKLCDTANAFNGKETTEEQLDNIQKMYFPELTMGTIKDPYYEDRHNDYSKMRITIRDEEGNVVYDPLQDPKALARLNVDELESSARLKAMRPLGYNPQVEYCTNALVRENERHDKLKERYPDSMGVVEFFGNAGTLYSDALYDQYLAQRGSAAKKLYDKGSYAENVRAGSNAMSPFNPGFQSHFGTFNTQEEYVKYTGIKFDPSLGALEITVPDRIRESRMQSMYEQCRGKFHESIKVNRQNALMREG